MENTSNNSNIMASRENSRAPNTSRKARKLSADPICAECPACRRASIKRGASSSRSSSKAPSVFSALNNQLDAWAASSTPASSRRVSQEYPREQRKEEIPEVKVDSTFASPEQSKTNSRDPSTTRETSEKPSGNRRSSAVFDTINRKLDVWVDSHTSPRPSVDLTPTPQEHKMTTCPVHGDVDVSSDDEKENTAPFRQSVNSQTRLTTIQSVGDWESERPRTGRSNEEKRKPTVTERSLRELSSDDSHKFWSLGNGNMWNYLGTCTGRSFGGI